MLPMAESYNICRLRASKRAVKCVSRRLQLARAAVAAGFYGRNDPLWAAGPCFCAVPRVVHHIIYYTVSMRVHQERAAGIVFTAFESDLDAVHSLF